jgi:O-antigen/teichoic acid export membrane protein
MGFLVLSTLIDNLTLNADRLMLMAFSGGVAVTVYYVASLFGKVVALLSVPINSIVISYLVKYEGGLTKKLWTAAITAVSVLGALAFGGCVIVSPMFLRILYTDVYTEAARYVAPAILGQIFYFTSGILLVILLRFRGEKKQFLFNLCYLIEFFVIVFIGTYKGGLDGFVYASLIANAIRFLAVLLLGFMPQKKNDGKI